MGGVVVWLGGGGGGVGVGSGCGDGVGLGRGGSPELSIQIANELRAQRCLQAVPEKESQGMSFVLRAACSRFLTGGLKDLAYRLWMSFVVRAACRRSLRCLRDLVQRLSIIFCSKQSVCGP